MTSNPNNVLSAVGHATWPAGIVSLHVQVTDSSGNDAGITPTLPTGSANPMTLAILLLQANSSYSAVAVGTLADGGAMLSAPFPFHTDVLPADVPFFTVADGGSPMGPYYLISNLEEASQLPTEKSLAAQIQQYVAVVNTAGQPVWYSGCPSASR